MDVKRVQRVQRRLEEREEEKKKKGVQEKGFSMSESDVFVLLGKMGGVGGGCRGDRGRDALSMSPNDPPAAG